jgi:hypothetical protein
LAGDLEAIGDALQVPIYFVLGNHDFYYGSIEKVRCQVRRLSQQRKELFWLEDAGCIHLTAEVALVGHGC